MTLKNPIADGDGDAQDGTLYEEINPNLEDDVREQEDETSPEELKQQRLNAISEAIRNDKEAEKQRAESEFYRTAHQVMKNPDTIVDVYRRDPQLAEKIAQENWNVSYTALLANSQSEQNNTSIDRSTVESMVQDVLSSHQKQNESREIENYLFNFLAENDIQPKTPLFKEILADFEEFKPSTLPKAQKILDMLLASRGSKRASNDDIDNVYIPRSRTTSPEKPSANAKKVSPTMRQYMESTYGAEYTKKYLSGK